MISPQKKALAICMLMMLVFDARAHTVWLEPTPGPKQGQVVEYRVRFGGHAGKLETYRPEKLLTVDALDARGERIGVKRSVESDGVHLQLVSSPSLVLMHFDNGIHTRGASGPSIEKPMNEVPGATRATHAVKYHKTIVEWHPLVTRSFAQPFEVMPLDAVAPRAGQPMRVRVLVDGKPAAGVRLGHGEEGSDKDPLTDADGVAAFVPVVGFNRLWAGRRSSVQNDPAYTELSYEYVLGFDAR